MDGLLREHYRALWGVPAREATFDKVSASVTVLKWNATERTGGVVMYATVGGWRVDGDGHPSEHRNEFFLGLMPEQDDCAATLALLAAHAEPMADAQTLEVAGGLWPGTQMDCWLLAEPQTDVVPDLLNDRLHVRWLQAVPLYPSERTWKVVHGADRLWAAWGGRWRPLLGPPTRSVDEQRLSAAPSVKIRPYPHAVIRSEGRGSRLVVAVSVLIAVVALGGIAAIVTGDRTLGRLLIGLAVVTIWLPIMLRKQSDAG